MQEEIVIQRKKSIKQRVKEFFADPKKRLIFIIVLGLILIAAVAVGLYFMVYKHPVQTAEVAKEEVKTTSYATKYYSTLDGSETDQDAANKHPLAIMVENHVDARPQAGLDKASIVYEAIAEGGITRFLSIFGAHEADKVGPVRSARPYFVDWAEGYNAYYAHVGGNQNALQQIISDKVLDLDQFKYSSAYWRDKSTNVSLEHTMFTSTLKLREQAAKLGYTTENKFRSYKFVNIEEPKTDDSTEEDATTPTESVAATPATNINVLFSTGNYNVKFQYDATANRYKRVLANGKVQADRESKAEIAPTNLIVMTVKRSPLVTKINEHGWLMDTIGEGDAKIFIDGKVIDGKWSKSSKSEREIFYDDSNQEIVFNRGQFWICVIPPDSSVNYE